MHNLYECLLYLDHNEQKSSILVAWYTRIEDFRSFFGRINNKKICIKQKKRLGNNNFNTSKYHGFDYQMEKKH